MTWIHDLSARQRTWLAVTLLAAVFIVCAGVVWAPAGEAPSTAGMTVGMSISRMAPQLETTGANLARELGLPLDAPKGRPLSELGITQEQLEGVVHHLAGHADSVLKYYIFAALVLLGLVYLVRLGRPDSSSLNERSEWYPRWPYVVVLLTAVAVCGFGLGKSPNPMEAAVKVFKSIVGLYPSVTDKILALIFFCLLAVVGNKLICGWACPFGALQELAYSLTLFRKVKRRKVPFVVANTVRAGLFAVMLLVLFGLVGHRKGMVIYHYINPFNLFNLDIETASIGITIAITLLLALVVYRPFCQFICPFGLIGWVLERVSIFRVRIDRDRCIDCGACARACPLEAADGRVAGKAWPADCFSCARCLSVCPVDAIEYGPIWGKRSPYQASPAQQEDVPRKNGAATTC